MHPIVVDDMLTPEDGWCAGREYARRVFAEGLHLWGSGPALRLMVDAFYMGGQEPEVTRLAVRGFCLQWRLLEARP